MAVKAKYTKEADVPEALKKDYKEVDGVWLLDVEGGNTATHVPKDEFDRVKTESEKRKEKLEAFKGLDPEKVKADAAELKELRTGAGNEEVKIKAATSRLTQELESERTAKGKLSEQLSGLLLDNRFKDEGIKAGIKPGRAMEMFVDAARKDFEVKDGELTPKNSAKGKDGKPLTPEDWTTERKADSGFLFAGSSGGGAGNAGSKPGGGDGSKPNPYKKGQDFNMTQQGLLEINNPTEAARMKAEAGV